MFWIEESPTSALDDDSDVPFDESPGRPMACEEEIELIIRPDDDHLYPYKTSSEEVDEDTCPETISQYGGTSSTLVSDEVDKDSIVKESDNDDNDNDSEEQDDASDHQEQIAAAEEAGRSPASVSMDDDDDATQVMGEHHTIEGPEDERTLTSAAQNSFVYSPPKVSAGEGLPNTDSSEAAPEDRAESSLPRAEDASNEERTEDIATVDDVATSIAVVSTDSTTRDFNLIMEPEQEEGTTYAPNDADSSEDSAPVLVSEPIIDDAENDVASMSQDYSETKPLNEMNISNNDDVQDKAEDADSESSFEVDWYDQYQPLEQTDDGISCISNMFAPISGPAAAEEEEGADMELLPSSLANPTMTTIFSDGGESLYATKSNFNKCSGTVKSEPQPLREAFDDDDDDDEYIANIRQATSFGHVDCPPASTTSGTSNNKMNKQVILIVEAEDEEGVTTSLTLEEYLNSNCMQGTRKERRKRIIERQRNALSRITPVMTSSHTYGTEAAGSGNGFLDGLLDFDPLGQLQNMMGLAD